MRPSPIVQIQAVVSLIVVLVCLVALQGEAAAAIGALLTAACLTWGLFGLRYWVLLRRRGPTWPPVSPLRRSRDRVMRQCFAVGLGVPIVLASTTAFMHPHLFTPPLLGAEAVLGGLSCTGIVLAVLVSSAVDWYLIRPFREGVFAAPACKPSVDIGAKERYQRFWIAHRLLSELLVYFAISGLIALATVVAKDQTTTETSGSILDVLGPVGIIGWTLFEIAKLKVALEFVRRPSDGGLGCWIIGRNDDGEDIEGLVLDAAIDPGIQLIDEARGHPAPDISVSEKSVPLKYRKTMHRRSAPLPICPGDTCAFWIPDCELGLRLHGDNPYPAAIPLADTGADGVASQP
jgi:hypothetical protein